jgi:hypothetical protein
MARRPATRERFIVASESLLFSVRDLVKHHQEQVRHNQRALADAEALQHQINELLTEGGYPYLDLEQAG